MPGSMANEAGLILVYGPSLTVGLVPNIRLLIRPSNALDPESD